MSICGTLVRAGFCQQCCLAFVTVAVSICHRRSFTSESVFGFETFSISPKILHLSRTKHSWWLRFYPSNREALATQSVIAPFPGRTLSTLSCRDLSTDGRNIHTRIAFTYQIHVSHTRTRRRHEKDERVYYGTGVNCCRPPQQTRHGNFFRGRRTPDGNLGNHEHTSRKRCGRGE